MSEFAALLPPEQRFAFEFRHPSWFDREVLALLRSRLLALCVNGADVEDCPLAPTAPWGIVKLRRPSYTRRELADWARRIDAQGWGEAFVFFEHEATAAGPRLAARLQELAEPSMARH